jgi:hypothetical protein
MGFWRSLRQWWCWDGSPDADPFRARVSDEEDGAVSGDFSGHAHTAADDESPQQADEDDP